MTERGFSKFLGHSLALLRAECRPAYDRIVQLLDGIEVAIEVNGLEPSVLADRGELWVLSTPVRPVVSARTDRRVLSRLLEGEYTLLEAVLLEDIWLRGSLDELLLFHEALETYFNGAVRCPSFPELLAQFLGSPQRAPEEYVNERPIISRGISA